MDVNYILLLITALIMALAYGLIGFFGDKVNTGGTWNWAKFCATVVYSIIVGVIAVNTGVITLQNIGDYSIIFSPIWIMYGGVYLGLIYVFSKVVVPVVSNIAARSAKVEWFPRLATVDPNRKMDPETRLKFFTDQPDALRISILKQVDEAEANHVWRYAIEAGAWIYLVEFGEVFGAKHYWYKFWIGSMVAQWKACTVACFEEIRTSCKFPDFDKLY